MSFWTCTAGWFASATSGRSGREIGKDQAWDRLAGDGVGQDISERTSQMADVPPKFSLAKSFAGFAPSGPWLTTLDELDDPTDLAISCGVDGEPLQASRTSRMIFDIPTIVEFVSSRCELRVGDLLFTGTPAGVGFTREPPRFLQRGTTLVSTIEGVGELRNPLV
ncbi:MAG: fumarylacetoacetate hydrolase family protein [Acidimicrobiales bacterium]